MKNVLHCLTLTKAIAVCAAPAVLALSSAEGRTETVSKTPNTRNLAVSARQNLALGRYDYNNVRTHFLLRNKTRSEHAGRLSNLTAPHPARLPDPKSTTINKPDSRYERGTTGGRSQVRNSSGQAGRLRPSKS